MRICRFSYQGVMSFGVLQQAETKSASDTEQLAVMPLVGHPFGEVIVKPGAAPLPLNAVKLLAPMLPSKIIGIGKNYAPHAAEMKSQVPDEPLFFLKPATSVIGPNEPIIIPHSSQQVEHEAELAVVIGRLCREVPVERAAEVILGYTCGNDVTARDLQARDKQWTRAKSFDTFCPLGPWIDTIPEDDPLAGGVELTCAVNGHVRQRASTSEMVFGVAELIAAVSAVMTLLPGDVILTGTPAGVGVLQPGDEVSVTCRGIGTLTNLVAAAD